MRIILFVSAACLLAWTSVPSVRAEAAADQELARPAYQILKRDCYGCHGQAGSAEGGFNYVLDRRQLVARRKVVPGDLRKSRLYRRIHDGEMPPEDEKSRPSAADVALLRRWIEAGAPDFNPATAAEAFVPPTALLEAIAHDLDRLPERDRRFTRYFSLTHLSNAGQHADQLQTYRNALAKLLNSLSWRRTIVVPPALGPHGTLLRIDLRAYRWTPKTWDLILSRYPYGVIHETEATKYVTAATRCEMPLVRGDWFVAVAATPPLYHQILQLPDSERDLETLLRVETDEDIQNERVVRAGFNGSGISRNNRVIERHEAAYGAYWRSYDFAGSSGIQNLFAHPLGPGDGETAFRHDGGEIIFNLPNGLQAYLLVDGKGNRLDRAPVAIVSDSKRPDRAVENGLSCMSCHARGLIDKADQVRPHVLKNPRAFSKSDADTVLALYPDQPIFQARIREDTERFRKAVAQTGTPFTATEPIAALALRFEAEMDLPLAAAEAGLPAPRFVQKCKDSPTLARVLGPLTIPGGTVQRQVFLDAFEDLVRELRLGTLYTFQAERRPPPDGLAVRADLLDGDPVRGTLGNGSITLCGPKGSIEIQANKILSLRFNKVGDTVATAREVLTGRITTREFQLHTDRGAVVLTRDRLRQISAAEEAPPLAPGRLP